MNRNSIKVKSPKRATERKLTLLRKLMKLRQQKRQTNVKFQRQKKTKLKKQKGGRKLRALRAKTDRVNKAKAKLNRFNAKLQSRIFASNSFFSKRCDVLTLPMHSSWVDKYTSDRIHFKKEGHDFIYDYLTRYISRFGTTFLDHINPSATASIDGKSKTHNEILTSAWRFTRSISDHTKLGDMVLIISRTSFFQIEAFIACMLCGRIPAMASHPSKKVHKDEFDAKIIGIIKASNPSLIICDEEDRRTLKQYLPVASLTESDDFNAVDLKPEDLAFAQFSSGTTGIPKVIKISHKDLLAHCHEYATMIGLKSTNTIASWLPLYHDMGMIACFWLPLITGCNFIHVSPFDWLSNPDILLQAIEEHKATHVWMPNFAFSLLSRRQKMLKKHDLSSVSQFISCSEITHQDNLTTFADAFNVDRKCMRVCYALAENIFAVSQSTHLMSRGKYISCGSIIPGTAVVIKNDGVDVTEIQDGSVWIQSSYMPANLPKDKFGYYDTGDYGFMHRGELYIMGRTDDMIISYGQNLFPDKTEALVGNIPGIIPGRVACFGNYNEKKGTEEICICAESDSTSTELRDLVRNSVAQYLGISTRCFILPKGWLIKTSSGKISRKRSKKKWTEEMLSKKL